MCFVVDDFGTWLGLTEVRARRPHTCDDCRGPIRSGETYRRAAWVVDGHVTAVKDCARCHHLRGLIEAREIAEGCAPYEARPPYGDRCVTEYLSDRGLSHDAALDALVEA